MIIYHQHIIISNLMIIYYLDHSRVQVCYSVHIDNVRAVIDVSDGNIDRSVLLLPDLPRLHAAGGQFDACVKPRGHQYGHSGQINFPVFKTTL